MEPTDTQLPATIKACRERLRSTRAPNVVPASSPISATKPHGAMSNLYRQYP
jgi:hypothetical protein